MKIELIKNLKRKGHKTLKKGQKMVVTDVYARELILKGFAKQKKFVSSQEQQAEADAIRKGREILENLPETSKELKKEIPTISNKIVLECLLKDDRKTVRDAAEKRLAAL